MKSLPICVSIEGFSGIFSENTRLSSFTYSYFCVSFNGFLLPEVVKLIDGQTIRAFALNILQGIDKSLNCAVG